MIRPWKYLPIALTLLALLPGCGGGGGKSAPKTTSLQIPVRWPDRSRAIDALSSARSAVITLKRAKPDGSDLRVTVNRGSNNAEHVFTYSSTEAIVPGTYELSVEFFADPNGAGASVGTALATVTIVGDGSGIGTVAPTGKIATVEISASQKVFVGQTKDLIYTCKDSNNVTIAVSQGSATFAITAGSDKLKFTNGAMEGVKAGDATVTATVDGKTSAASTITVETALSLSFNPATVGSGKTTTGTVTLAFTPSANVTISLESSNVDAATVPATVVINSGTTNKTFTVTAKGVNVSTIVTITARNGEDSGTGQVTVSPAVVESVSLSPALVPGGSDSEATITLSGPAPVGGLTVNLASDNSAVASIPSTITIAEGQTTGKATITTTTVTVNTNATITASREGVSKTAILTVSPLLNTVSFNPSSLPGGEKSTGTVTLAGPAPSDTVVSLSSDNTPVASVPDTVTVLKDASTATFEVSTGAVANNTVVTIAASFGGVQKSAPITVQPLLKSVAFSPDHIFSTQKTTGTVTLNKAAAAGGHVVSLTSSNSTIAPVPATVTVPQGQLSADFEVIAGPVSENFDATITADLAGATASDTITVKPALVSIALSPDKVKIGAQSTATITLGAPAPAGGLVVTLTSDAEYATLSSASVTVLQGASTATVTVTGIKDTSNLGGGGSNAGTTPIRAALHGHEETARLTVKP